MRVPRLVVPLVLAAAPLAGQQAPALEPGARIRVTVDGAGPHVQVGVYQGVRDTILVLQAGSAPISIPLGRLRQVEVSRGRKGHWRAGAGVGFLVGVGAAVAFEAGSGSTAPCDQEQNQDAMSSGECLGIAAAGVALSTGLGALVGGLVRTERWQEVPVEGLRLTMVPRPGRRLGLGIAFTF